MSDYTDIYKNLLIKQYWNKANAVAEVELRAGAYERVYQILRDFETEFDLDVATGDRLDKIGKIVGISREDLEPYFDLFFGFSDNSNSLPMGFKFSTYWTGDAGFGGFDEYILDPLHTNTNYTLSNGNRTLYCDTTDTTQSSLSNWSINSGKVYWEIQIDSTGAYDDFGIGIAGHDENQRPGWDNFSWGLFDYLNGSIRKYHNSSYTTINSVDWQTGDIAMFALDVDNHKFWGGKNGTWFESGDPANGTNPQFEDVTITGDVFASVHLRAAGNQCTTCFLGSEQTYSAPSGFSVFELSTLEELSTPEYTAGKFFDKFYTGTIPGVLTDDEYRFYIKAKISVNSATGYMVSDDYISIQQVIQYLFDGYAIVFDDMVMSLTLEVEDSINKGRVLLARDLNLLPRPQGVEYNAIARAGYDYFGWSDDPNAEGWGTWSDGSIGGIFATYI